MALTDKKRRFVDALLSGLSGAKAAIHAGYSENGAAQAAARLMRDKHVLAALGRVAEVNKTVNKKAVNKKGKTQPPVGETPQADVALPAPADESSMGGIGLKALGLTSDPRAVLVAIMNDAREEPKLRLEAAKALMPFTHGKVADQGKKDAQKAAANKVAAGGRFNAPPPPTHLRVVGKG
ncbi:terminase small subunit [Achromobacter xylosoxidans]